MAWLKDGVPWGTTREARFVDQRAASELGLPGLVLMETAGGQAAEAIWSEWLARGAAPTRKPRVACLCGGGNNGGDGFVVARRLFDRAEVASLVATDPHAAPSDAQVMARASAACGIAVHDLRSVAGFDSARAWLREADIVVDAVLGTGARRPVGQGARLLLEALEQSRHAVQGGASPEPARLVVALDLPSGGCGDTGECDPLTPRCSLTVTFGIAKVGLGRAPLAGLAGRILVADLGLPLSIRTPEAAPGIGKEPP